MKGFWVMGHGPHRHRSTVALKHRGYESNALAIVCNCRFDVPS
jgi:hypothetical protein